MKNSGKKTIWAVGSVMLALLATHATAKITEGEGDASATASDNPFTSIAERNIFDLKPAAVISKEIQPTAPPANIKLTGITTLMGMRQALFLVSEGGGPGKQAKDHSFILSEGQRAGVLEVVNIDTKARTARIKNDGIESTINIETNRAAGTSSPGGNAGMPGAHVQPVNVPGAGRAGVNYGNQFNPGSSIPQRPVRPEGTSLPNGGGLNLSGYANPIPVNQGLPNQQTMTPEEQRTLLDLEVAKQSPLSLIVPPSNPNFNLNNPQSQSSPSQGPPSLPTSVPLGTKTTGNFLIPGR